MAAKVHIALVETGFVDGLSQAVSTVSSVPYESVRTTSTASSVIVATIQAPDEAAASGRTKLLWLVTATGGDIDVAFDPEAPNAAGDKTHCCPAGVVRDFPALPGQKVAIKDVA